MAYDARMLRTTSVVIALALAAPACKTKIDGEKGNELVEKMLAGHGIVATAACPSGLPAKKGSKFQCAAKVNATGQNLTIDVEMMDDQGNVNAVLVGTIVDTAKYVESIRTELGVPAATLKCPSTVVVATQAEPVNCEVTDGTVTRKLQIVEVDPVKHMVRWRMADENGNFPELEPLPDTGSAPPSVAPTPTP